MHTHIPHIHIHAHIHHAAPEKFSSRRKRANARERVQVLTKASNHSFLSGTLPPPFKRATLGPGTAAAEKTLLGVPLNENLAKEKKVY